MQRLRAAEDGGERLWATRDVVHRLLRVSVTPAVCEWKRMIHERGCFAISFFHVARPDPPRGPELGDFLEEIVVDVPEEGKPRSEVVDVEAASDAALDVGEAVGERERKLLRSRRSGLANVVA